MRIWAEVYDASGNKLGNSQINDIISTKVRRELDAAGSFDFTVATSKNALETLTNEREVRVFFKRDDLTNARELYRGYIRQNRMEVGKTPTLSFSGVTSMDALARRSVLLGRVFDAQPISAIASNLISLVPGWYVEVDSAIAGDLQSSRFDGASVLKALIRTAEEKGVHIRESARANTVEIGAFGVSNGLRFIKPPSSVGMELAQNNDVVLINKISQTDSTADLVNWIIPLGAGEGSAALTLKDSTRTSPYAIKTITAPNGATLYYLADGQSIANYGQIERVVTFKEIAPIANSDSAKIAAANALYDAAAAWLRRNSVKLTTYKLTGCKVAQAIRPGDKIRIQYTGTVDTPDSKLTYININDDFWVMSVTESFSKSGLSVDLDVTTIDRHAQDVTRIVVGMLDDIEVQNVAVKTGPVVFPVVGYDTLKYGSTIGAGLNLGKYARMDLRINNFVTNVSRVELRFITFPNHVTGRTTVDGFGNYWTFHSIVTSDDYPSGIVLRINDVDVTAALGGPWNSGINVQTDQTVDISNYILKASGGVYQNHKIEFFCESRFGDASLGSPDPTFSTEVSMGNVLMIVSVIGAGRAIITEAA